jgi:NAD(P)-dependent dehydrogenase (short-subunit alcohol dehydrogenase family)
MPSLKARTVVIIGSGIAWAIALAVIAEGGRVIAAPKADYRRTGRTKPRPAKGLAGASCPVVHAVPMARSAITAETARGSG